MTWHPTTPPWYRDAAETVCTHKQLEVLLLASHDLTTQQIADRLGITRQAAWARYDAATRAIRQHLENDEERPEERSPTTTPQPQPDFLNTPT